MGETEIGRWLGVSHRVGQLMSYWILPESGIPISVTKIQRMRHLEKSTDKYKKEMIAFEGGLQERFDAKSSDILSAQKMLIQ